MKLFADDKRFTPVEKVKNNSYLISATDRDCVQKSSDS